MRLTRPTSLKWLLLPLFFAALKAGAQLAPADDFFNNGAQFYISNNIPAAKERVETGLKMYPDDVKLKKLEELLKQQQQSQNSESQQNQQQQKSQSQKKSNSQKNQQQNQQQPQQNPADQKKDEDQKQAQQQKSNEEKKENQKGENQPVAGQMTPEEVKRLLDGQKGDEQVLQFKPQGKPENPNQSVKDW